MTITDPRDIPGLVAWYSADCVLGVASGDPMTQWDDLSGNGNHATAITEDGLTPLWYSTGGPGGGPRVSYPNPDFSDTGGYFTLPDLLNGAPSGEIMVTIKGDPAITSCSQWSFGAGTGGSDMSHYPNAATIYESFGLATGTRQNFAPTEDITNWHRYNVWSASNDWAARLDEGVQAVYAFATPTWDPAPRLGKGRRGGTAEYVFCGDMACVVIYSRKLTTGERADLAAWLELNPSGACAGAPAADYYEVTINGGPPTNVGTSLCDTFNDLLPGIEYEVCVRACTEFCCSEYVCITVTTAVPGPNVGVVACPCGNPVTS